ncbi:Nucleoside permease NupC [Klebsiella pneumoniae]|nr:Nucleoside permease NupC [Klebsiella pneumoniae]
MQILMGLIGMVVLLAIAVLLSNNRKAINLRTVLGAWIIQVGIGALILYVPAGRSALLAMSNGVASVIAYGNEGISFIFGGLVSDKMFEVFGGGGFVFALRVLPVIVFFSSLICRALLPGHYAAGHSHSRRRAAGSAEDLTYRIAVGHGEHLCWPDRSAAGGASLYRHHDSLGAVCGHVRRPGLGGGLGTGGLCADGAFRWSTLLPRRLWRRREACCLPKLSYRKRKNRTITRLMTAQSADADKPANVLDAAASGAASGMQLALNVGAMLLAFIALIALLNGILSGVGGWFNHPELSLQMILGWIFSPLAWVIGVPWHEATVAGSFIGQKLIINEFVAYMNFGEYLKADAEVAAAGLQVISDHTKAIISFALCGFANLSSIAILIGGLGGMAPNRRQDIAQLGLRAVAAGTLSNLDERHHRRGFSRPVSLSPEPAATVPLVLL